MSIQPSPLLRLPTEVLATVIKDLRHRDLAGLMRVHSILHEVCIQLLYSSVRIGVEPRRNPPINKSRFLRHVRSLEVLPHPPSECWNGLCRFTSFTEPHSVAVVRYSPQMLDDHRCPALVGLRPSTIVFLASDPFTTRFRQIVPTTCWKSVRNVVLWLFPDEIPAFLSNGEGSWLVSGARIDDYHFDQAIKLQIPTLTWILDYAYYSYRESPEDITHMLLRIGWAALASARSDCHQHLLFSCVIPDWAMPISCLHVVRRVLQAHREYNGGAPFHFSDESMARMEVITMSEFLSRPGNKHVMSQEEARMWRVAPESIRTPPSLEDAVKWVRPEEWAEDDQESHPGLSLAEQYSWFPSADTLRGDPGATSQG